MSQPLSLIYMYKTVVFKFNNYHYNSILQAVRNLSCIAKENSIYLVSDVAEQADCELGNTLCQIDNLSFFNTQVVFDRSGTVIAR